MPLNFLRYDVNNSDNSEKYNFSERFRCYLRTHFPDHHKTFSIIGFNINGNPQARFSRKGFLGSAIRKSKIDVIVVVESRSPHNEILHFPFDYNYMNFGSPVIIKYDSNFDPPKIASFEGTHIFVRKNVKHTFCHLTIG